MNKKTIIIIAAIFSLALIGYIGQLITGETPTKTTTETTTTEPAVTKIDRTKAYVIAKQFAKAHLGNVDFGIADDGFEDMADNNYMVTGVADMPNTHFRWTIDLQYKGGDWSKKNNWIEKSWFVK